jgi:hypothetical protein
MGNSVQQLRYSFTPLSLTNEYPTFAAKKMGKIPSAEVDREPNNLQAKLYWQIVARFSFYFLFSVNMQPQIFFRVRALARDRSLKKSPHRGMTPGTPLVK